MKLYVEKLNVSLGGKAILKDIELVVDGGEFISILGNSGCGKTTLIKSIAGLIKVDSGNVFINNEDVTKYPPEKRGTVIVFQDVRLFPNMNVAENISFSLRLKKASKEHMREVVEYLLKEVRLEGFENRKIGELSGGQMQRVAIARALAAKPHILLLDEPFASLDTELREEMGELVRNIHRKNGITTIMITHDKKEAMVLSDKIVLMEDGRILDMDTPIEMFTKPKSKKIARMLGNINLFEVEVKNNRVCVEIADFETELEDGKYILGIRPTELSIVNTAGVLVLVEEINFRGEFVEILLRNEEGEYILKLGLNEFNDRKIKKGNELRIRANKEELSLFRGHSKIKIS